MVSRTRSDKRGVQRKKLVFGGACLMMLLLTVYAPNQLNVWAAGYGAQPAHEAERLHLVSGQSMLLKQQKVSLQGETVAQSFPASADIYSPNYLREVPPPESCRPYYESP